MCYPRIPPSGPMQSFIHSSDVYWDPALCQMSRTHWQTRQAESLPSKMSHIRRHKMRRRGATKLFTGSTDLGRKVETKDINFLLLSFLSALFSSHSLLPNDGMVSWVRKGSGYAQLLWFLSFSQWVVYCDLHVPKKIVQKDSCPSREKSRNSEGLVPLRLQH